jgi:hypothetical protein
MAKHYFQITFEVHPQDRSTFQEALSGVLEAYASKTKGHEIRVLGSFIGEGNEIILEIGLNSLADMDAWSRLPDAVRETHGEDKAKSLLEKFSDSLIATHSRVLSEFRLQ